MTDPRRLSDVGDAFQQALLRSARRDHGSSAAEARCLVAATTAASMLAHTAGASASASAAASIANTALGTGSVGVGFTVKAMALGFALGLGVQGAVVVGSRISQPPAAQPGPASVQRAGVQTPTTRAPTRIAAEPFGVGAAPETVGTLGSEVDPANARENTPTPGRSGASVISKAGASANGATERTAPSLTSESAAPGSVASSGIGPGSVAPSVANDLLEREVVLVDQARLAYRAKSYDLALALLDRHQRDFPRGSLGPEALVVRVQALVGLGRRAEAQRLALPYLTTYTSSPISQRLRSVLGQPESTR